MFFGFSVFKPILCLDVNVTNRPKFGPEQNKLKFWTTFN